MLQLLVDEQKELIRNLLFSSTNMAAMMQRENHLTDLSVRHIAKVGIVS